MKNTGDVAVCVKSKQNKPKRALPSFVSSNSNLTFFIPVSDSSGILIYFH